MSSPVLLIDFGSTFTKCCAVELDSSTLIGRSQAPTTVLTDVRDGLLGALRALHECCGVFETAPRDLSVLDGLNILASSSAAGGLRLVVVGNVPGLTVEAANQAALGAGAKLVGSTAFKLTPAKLAEVEKLKPDMILLTGGVDGGDAATVLHNAELLGGSQISVPIVYAGNVAAAEQAAQILQRYDKEVQVVDNVMPSMARLAVDSAREAIRELFMARITHAKGLDALQGMVPVVLPTPMAVLEGVRVGAEGADGEAGWGDMLVVDVGGATTDIHSIGWGEPQGENMIAQGIAEAYAKRTVEGDLGIRYNAGTILSRVGVEPLVNYLHDVFPATRVTEKEFCEYVNKVSRNTETVPESDWQVAADAILARSAVDIAIARHVGRRERIVAREGEAWLHYGKDMRETKTLIGTGGIFLHNPHAAKILAGGDPPGGNIQTLRPRSPRVFVDASYVLYAAGLLSTKYPVAAVRLFKRYLKPMA